jgi:uncharacterized protein (TIGR02646 family)
MNEEIRNNLPLVRSEVEPKKNYLEYRQELRFDFVCSCAYCSMTELEASGIGFEIDHYYPRKYRSDLIHNYENLMWSCQYCNRYKSDYYPSEERQSKGHVIIRPDKDDPRKHFEAKKYRLEGKTETGRFNIDVLELNRQQLRRVRQIRERLASSLEYISHGIHHLLALKIDKYNPKHRLLIVAVKDRVREKHGFLCDCLENILRQYACSPLLDDDPDKEEHSKRRKMYLDEQKAITADYPKIRKKRS